ncbi:Tyrosine-protein kinase ptk [compost metagenome]
MEEVSVVDHSTVTSRQPVDADDLSVMDVLAILVKRRKLVMVTVVVATAAATVLGLLAPKQYTAKATLLPIESKQGLGALGMLEGGLGSMIAAQAGVGMSASTKLVTILESRSLAEGVIQKLDLMPVLFENRWDAAKKTWKPSMIDGLLGKAKSPPTLLEGGREMDALLGVSEDKQSLVAVEAKTNDPELSAAIVAAYVQELEAYLQKNALSSAKRNRLFIEKQLADVQKELAAQEVDLKRFQEKHSLVSLDAQAEASINTYATLKAQLIAKEVQLEVLENSGSFGDVEANAVRKEVAGLQTQLQKLETGASKGATISLKDAPELGLQYVQIKRNLMVKQKVFELLVQQFEMAKIEEAKEDISFQLLDPAVAPDEPSNPKLPLLIAIALLASVLLGAFLALGMEYVARHREEFRRRLQQLEGLPQ